jgi:hypothetical protein
MDTDVPYICDEPEPYDGGLFSEYPIRKGRPWMVYTGTDKRKACLQQYSQFHKVCLHMNKSHSSKPGCSSVY